MKELEKSIKNQGIVTAITVRPLNGNYEVVAGMRRYKAAMNVGLKAIPALIKTLTDEEAKLLSITENLERADLTPIEEARSYADYLGWNETTHFKNGRDTKIIPRVELLASKLPIGQSTIYNRLNLLHLPESIQTLVDQGMKLRVAENIARLRQLWSIYKESGVPEDKIRPKIHRVMELISSQVNTEEQARDRVNAYMRTEQENLTRRSSQVDSVQKKFDEAEQALLMYIHGHDLPENIAVGSLQEKSDWFQLHVDSNIKQLSDENLQRISNDRANATAQHDRYSMNLEYVKQIVLDTCPHCGAGVNIQNLQKRIDELDDEIKALNEEEGETGAELKTWRDAKKKLEGLLREYKSQERTLEAAKRV